MSQKELTVNPWQLTLLMILLVAGPIACGLLLYAFSKPMKEPPLPAWIKLDTTWIESKEGGRRLLPCIVVKNVSNAPWGKLSIGINEQFYSTGNMELAGGAETAIPLEAFVARNGSTRFPVATRKVEQVTVFAQLSTGARGISEFYLSGDQSEKETEWMKPSSAINLGSSP
jgi:hypothetical protein